MSTTALDPEAVIERLLLEAERLKLLDAQRYDPRSRTSVRLYYFILSLHLTDARLESLLNPKNLVSPTATPSALIQILSTAATPGHRRMALLTVLLRAVQTLLLLLWKPRKASLLILTTPPPFIFLNLWGMIKRLVSLRAGRLE